MKKRDFLPLPENDDECEKIFDVIKFVVFLLAICLIILAVFKLVHWGWPALAVLFYFWNTNQYRIGCFHYVIDEYDDHKRGYPHYGLQRMYKSWKVFAIIVAFAVIAMIVTP